MKNKFFISKQYNHLVGAVHWREMRWKRHKRYFFNRNKKKGKWKEETKSIFKCRCFWWHESIRDERGRRVCGMKQSIHELLKHVQMKGRNEWTYRQFTIRLYRMRYKLTFFFFYELMENFNMMTRRRRREMKGRYEHTWKMSELQKMQLHYPRWH